jgi:predicted nucleic acid-binding Zn ribbon protein
VQLCPYCHTVVSEDTRFCPECGRSLTAVETVKGKSMNTKLKVFLIAILIISAGINIVLYANYRSLQDQTNSLKQEITTLQQENNNLKEELQGTLPYSKANGIPIKLWNNLNGTHNPTWKELKNFLNSDNTESIRYDYNSFVCGDFAERLHNNAERAGIRAAVVIVYFTSGSPHAIDAFYTTDKGLVFIDCTGASFFDGYWEEAPFGLGKVWRTYESEDKVAYISVGKEYGLIELSSADSTEYSFYTSYSVKIANYNEQLESYNAEVDAYNRALGGRVFLDEPEYSYFLNWYDRLEEERAELNRIASTLPDYYYMPMGIVSKVEIYWNTAKWNG